MIAASSVIPWAIISQSKGSRCTHGNVVTL